MNATTIAIVDLGTNTFNLLIGKVNLQHKEIVYEWELPVMLGKGGIQNNMLTEAGMQRALAVLEQFDVIIQQHGVETVKAFATSAIRNATNGKAFAQLIENKFKYQLFTITGNTEAAYIYEGAKQVLLNHAGNFLVMDIGGGSVEFIIGNAQQLLWKQSLEMGALRLSAMFQDQDPMRSEQIEALKMHCQKLMLGLKAALAEYPVNSLVGTAGPFESFKEMLNQHFQVELEAKNRHAAVVPIAAFLKLSATLKQTTTEQRSQLKGLIPFRKDLIVIGALLVESVLEMHSFEALIVVDYALKEGVFFSEI